MTAKFEKVETNKVVLTFEISQEDIKKGLDQAFNRVKKNVNVPGFRKGKVSRQVFEKMYGEEALYQDALNILLPDAYDNAVEETGIFPVTQPTIDIESIEKGKPWVIKAEVIVKPEVKLGEYKGLTVEKQDRTVSEQDVEDRLLQEQARAAELVVKEDAAELGDTVVIDFEGFLGDEAFEGGKGENHSLELGSGSFIPGFEDQLVGTKEGDEVEVKVTFPLKNIHEHQLEHMKECCEQGGIAFVIFYFSSLKEYYLLEYKWIEQFIYDSSSKRQSIPLTYIQEHGQSISLSLQMTLNYLDAVDTLL